MSEKEQVESPKIEESKETSGISRRDFLKAVGVGTAAVAAVAAVPPLAAAGIQEPSAPGVKINPSNIPRSWDYEADVVIIGSGAVGIPAAIRARDAGASVIIVECNYDTGGHAITSGGNVPIGGGTAYQKKYGIVDSPDLYFNDLTDWSVTEISGLSEYRYNDRGVQRALADNGAPCFDFLLENGADFVDAAPDNSGAHATGCSARREHHTRWGQGQSAESPAGAAGTGLMRPLERSARKKGVKFLLNYHMDTIYRESVYSGKVIGIMASYTPTILPGTDTPLKSFLSDGNIERNTPTVTIRAFKSVVVATGGSTGNVEFRRIFDPRLTKEVQNAASEYSPQDGSGEMAAMAIGASLSGTANHTMDRNGYLRKRSVIGTLTNYINWTPNSPLFPKIKFTGVNMRSWQNAIIVNQAGKRFYNEMEDGYPNGTHENFFKNPDFVSELGYVHGDWRNPRKVKYKPENYADAALAMNEGSQAPYFSAGPQWAILDQDGVDRLQWDLSVPYAVDPDIFFKADTLAELANRISTSSWSTYRMQGSVLEETVARYNSFVDSGVDSDFEKPKPQYKIQKAPFYAAWATFTVHDTYAGLRINMKCQVEDMYGNVIPGLFCGGESAGGCSQHGLARCVIQGYIIGKECVA